VADILTPAELADLRALAEAATPGEVQAVQVDPSGNINGWIIATHGDSWIIETVGVPGDLLAPGEADARYAAALHNAAPRLLAAVEAQAARIAALEAGLREACLIARQRNAHWLSAALDGDAEGDRREIQRCAERTDDQLAALRSLLTPTKEADRESRP
jgi:hypothetical protein